MSCRDHREPAVHDRVSMATHRYCSSGGCLKRIFDEIVRFPIQKLAKLSADASQAVLDELWRWQSQDQFRRAPLRRAYQSLMACGICIR